MRKRIGAAGVCLAAALSAGCLGQGGGGGAPEADDEIYGGAGKIWICVEDSTGGDAAAAVGSVAEASHEDPTSDWNKLPAARVDDGCPEGQLKFANAATLEHTVTERSEYLLHVHVTDEDVPRGARAVPYEMRCEGPHNCGEVTSVLFVTPATVADDATLRRAVEDALGMNLPSVAVTPGPEPTKDIPPTPTPLRPIAPLLDGRPVCVLAAPSHPDGVAIVSKALTDALADTGRSADVPSITGDCGGITFAEAGAAAAGGDELAAEEFAIVVVVPERWTYSFMEGFHRTGDDTVVLYVNPGLLDSPSSMRGGFAEQLLGAR